MKEPERTAEGCPDEIAEALATSGWIARDAFLDAGQVRGLAEECRAGWQGDAFREARIGSGGDAERRPEVRGDHILWIDPGRAPRFQRSYLGAMEELRLALNRRLYLGLFDFEAHFAVYPPGTHYGRHVDRFQGDDRRVVSTVLYLNDGWSGDEGGQLRLHVGAASGTNPVDVLPAAGRLVLFLSDGLVHEVLPARRERMSVTGWFRRRG